MPTELGGRPRVHEAATDSLKVPQMTKIQPNPNPSSDNYPYDLYEFANMHGLPLSAAEVVLRANGPSRAKCDAAAQAYLKFVKPGLNK